MLSPKLQPQTTLSLADHPQATMSSLTLNVDTVRFKYFSHVEELAKLERNFHIMEPQNTVPGKIKKIHSAKIQSGKSPSFKVQENEEENEYKRLICLIPAHLRVYIPQYFFWNAKKRAIAEFKKNTEKYLKWKEINTTLESPLPDIDIKMPYGDELTNDEEQIEKW